MEVLQRLWFFIGWFSGSIVSIGSLKFTLMLGTLGYRILVGSSWHFE